MTQAQLGESAGLLRQQVDRYESGESRVAACYLCAFAETLCVSLLYFFPDHHQPMPAPVSPAARRLADECGTLPADTLKHLVALVRSFKAHGVAA